MPAYGFTETTLTPPGYGYGSDCLRCDLSRPTDELLVVAGIVSHASVFQAWVVDAALVLRLHGGHEHEDKPEVVERLARWHIEAARAVMRETAAGPDPLSMRLLADPDQPCPVAVREVGFYDFVQRWSKGSDNPFRLLPDEFHRDGCLVHPPEEGEEGEWPVTFAVGDYSPSDLEDAVLGFFGLMSGISARKSKWPERFRVDAHRMSRAQAFNYFNAALRLARTAIAAGKSRAEAMPMKGEPSIFTAEDDDARDLLLAEIVAGGRIDVFSERGGDDWVCTLGDVTVPAYIVRRLLQSRWLDPIERGWRHRTSFVLSKYAPKATPRTLAPRDHAVSFASFQDWCRYRRNSDDDWRECSHSDKGDQSICGCHGCPLTTPVYRGDVQYFSDDPAFAWHDSSEIDVMVVADDVRTERSKAWRAAGSQRVEAVVDLVAGAYVNYSVPYLCGETLSKAAREAVEAGYLEVVEETALGPIVGLGAALKARYDEAIAQRAHAQG